MSSYKSFDSKQQNNHDVEALLPDPNCIVIVKNYTICNSRLWKYLHKNEFKYRKPFYGINRKLTDVSKNEFSDDVREREGNSSKCIPRTNLIQDQSIDSVWNTKHWNTRNVEIVSISLNRLAII